MTMDGIFGLNFIFYLVIPLKLHQLNSSGESHFKIADPTVSRG